jgi:hypothetical protein
MNNQHKQHKKEEQYVYYNMELNGDVATGEPKLATLVDNRSVGVIENPKDYCMSVARFSCPGTLIPIFIWDSIGPTGQKVVDNTTYQVGLRFTDPSGSGVYDGSANLIYVSQNMSAASTSEEYYYIYSYQQFINIINTGLTTAFNNLATVCTNAGHPLPVDVSGAPFMTFDAVTGICKLTALKSYVTKNMKVFFSQGLYSFFENFNAIDHVDMLIGGSDNYMQIIVEDTKNNSVDIPGFGSCYVMTQEFNSLYLWNEFKSLVIISATIPIKDEFAPTSNNTSSNQLLRILTDLEPIVQQGPEARSVIQYVPSGEYRRIDLQSVGMLNTLDIRILWKDIYGVLHSVYIPPNGSPATIKFLFEHK